MLGYIDSYKSWYRVEVYISSLYESIHRLSPGYISSGRGLRGHWLHGAVHLVEATLRRSLRTPETSR